MIVHQVFAQIKGEDIKNIIVCDNYELANQLSRMVYGDDAFAQECTLYPVSIGDKFMNRAFYFKDGKTIVPRKASSEEQVVILENENSDLKSRIKDMESAFNDLILEGGK